ncbi:Oligosaccharyltransferase 48 kDa subunit beta [Gracilaria domingensis]|nr:Oligosaccharyltransferase 48 kDa subunit beta [Gracilaria domingensis]
MRVLTLVTLLAVFSLIHAALPLSSPSILVVGDDVEKTHSQFLSALGSLNSTVTYKQTTSDGIALISDGEYVYSTVILLCPRASLERKLSVSQLLRFIDAGNNLFVSGGDQYSSYTSKVIESMGVDLDDKGSLMRDHQKVFTAMDGGDHTYIQAGGMTPSPYLFGDAYHDPSRIAFKGPGATLFNDNELVDAVIWGSTSSYGGTGEEIFKIPRVVGSSAVLAAALSTRVGGRASYFGSFHALSNEVFEAAGASHQEAMKNLLTWTLGARGVLRVSDVRYQCVDETRMEMNECRVKDFVNFEMDVQVWEAQSGTWQPFVTDDMQLEFTMLNPWVRTRLQASENGTFKAKVPIPDQIGVYKLSVQYFRPGVSPISMEKVVPVRPYLHNEYERFIPMAAPYYVASFSMIGGAFLLGLVLLFGNEKQREKEE